MDIVELVNLFLILLAPQQCTLSQNSTFNPHNNTGSDVLTHVIHHFQYITIEESTLDKHTAPSLQTNLLILSCPLKHLVSTTKYILHSSYLPTIWPTVTQIDNI